MEKEILKLEVNEFKTFEELYNSIDENGSLGLLALGSVGLFLWRKKRNEIEKEKGEKFK